jgi:heme oxygenase
MTPHLTANGQETAVSFLEKIKSETGDAHRTLENLPIPRALLAPTLSPQDYRRYLLAMRRINHDIEKRVFPLLTAHFSDLETRIKTGWINADLGDTECFEPATVFDISDRSEAFLAGILYTVEGSTLGGRFIMAGIAKSLGVTANQGARYFAGYGNETGLRWKRFLQELSPLADAEPEQVIAGASHAFHAIGKQLEAA